MKATFSTLAFSTSKILAASGHTVSSSHAQQLLAAALGYASLASLQASTEEQPGLQHADIVILDVAGVIVRAAQLGHAQCAEQIADAIAQAIRNDPAAPALYNSWGEFVENKVVPYASEAALDDEAVSSAAASTNAMFDEPAEIEIPSIGGSDPASGSWKPNVSACGGFFEVPITGTITMDQDEDRMYSGHILNIAGTVQIEKAGRRCMMDYLDMDLGAAVDDSHYEN